MWSADHLAEFHWLVEWGLAAAVFSALVAVAATLAVASAMGRLPEDYLVRERLHPEAPRRVVRRIAGVLLVMAGVVMLVVPGPGIASIVIGLVVLDMPILRRWVVALLSRPSIARAVNAARRRMHRPPLIVPPSHPPENAAKSS